jgi:hypothetical protein
MTTEKQIEANRRNAQKSTGPKTETGKQRASRNAAKHGLYAASVVLNSPHYKEDPKEYNHLLASLIWELRPEGVLQHSLVHKIANALWRYKRLIRAETGNLHSRLEDVARNDFSDIGDRNDPETEDARQYRRELIEHHRETMINRSQIPYAFDAVNLLRYEMRLDRQLARSYKLLRALQDRRDAVERANEREKDRNRVPEK